MKWRSKATGVAYEAYDSFKPTWDGYFVALKAENEKIPAVYMTYSNLIEAFERVEDEEPIREGMYDGWDTE
jgi:hypothetical protein